MRLLLKKVSALVQEKSKAVCDKLKNSYLAVWKENTKLKHLKHELEVQLKTVKNFLNEPNLNSSARVRRIKKYLNMEPIVRGPNNRKVK